MGRLLAAFLVAAAVVALTASAATALKIAMKPPTQRAVTADAIVVGKVTAVEKDAVEAAPFPGAPNKVLHKVAVVKVESSLAGAGNVTHLKVAFVPPPASTPQAPGGGIRPPRRGPLTPELKEGQEFLFFLAKHPETGLYVMPPMSPPVAAQGEEYKKELEDVKKVLAVLADPMKSLKQGKAEERYFAAATLLAKYRTYPDFAQGEVDQVPIGAEESKLILKGLSEGDWTKFDRSLPNGMQAFYSLGLSEQDGWKQPRPQPVRPGQPPVNFNKVIKDAYVQWLAGPGKDYQIKRMASKKQ